MNRKLHTCLWKVCLIALLNVSVIDAIAQDVSVEPIGKPKSLWSGHISVGLNAFDTQGIPASRNQVNYSSLSTGVNSRYQQESRGFGIGFVVALKYQLFNKGKVGFYLNAFKDDPEYASGTDQRYNVSRILADSMNRLSIFNMQSYLNIGTGYEQRVYQSPSGRHGFYASMAFGVSINRTPDRTEYDALDPEHFVVADTTDNGVWFITRTHFSDGFFMTPTVMYQFNFNPRHAIHVSICEMFQWHNTVQWSQIRNINSRGVLNRERYTLKAFELKIGYSF